MNLFQAEAKTSRQRGQLEVMKWKRLQSQDSNYRQCSGGLGCFQRRTWLEDTGRVLHFLGRHPQPLKDQNGWLSSQVGQEPMARLAPLTQRPKVQHMNLFQAGITPALQHDKRTSLQCQDFNCGQYSGGLGCFRRRTWLEDTGLVFEG